MRRTLPFLLLLAACAPVSEPAAPARLLRVAALGSPVPQALVSCLPPSPTPGPSAPGYGCETTIVAGTVYGPDGLPADGAVVRIEGLDASVPYVASTTTSQGSWVINNVPGGASVEILAHGDGWEAERRVGSFGCGAGVRNWLELRPATHWPAAIDLVATP